MLTAERDQLVNRVCSGLRMPANTGQLEVDLNANAKRKRKVQQRRKSRGSGSSGDAVTAMAAQIGSTM
eukprot:24019-Eustigmatos_ZCMA.PRE.1